MDLNSCLIREINSFVKFKSISLAKKYGFAYPYSNLLNLIGSFIYKNGEGFKKGFIVKGAQNFRRKSVLNILNSGLPDFLNALVSEEKLLPHLTSCAIEVGNLPLLKRLPPANDFIWRYTPLAYRLDRIEFLEHISSINTVNTNLDAIFGQSPYHAGLQVFKCLYKLCHWYRELLRVLYNTTDLEVIKYCFENASVRELNIFFETKRVRNLKYHPPLIEEYLNEFENEYKCVPR